jgi:signal transduction histidine kinase
MAEGGAVCIAGEQRPLRPAIATALLRIGQEAIANAIRHADPTRLGITLFYDEGRVTLSVTDRRSPTDAAAVRGDCLGTRVPEPKLWPADSSHNENRCGLWRC